MITTPTLLDPRQKPYCQKYITEKAISSYPESDHKSNGLNSHLSQKKKHSYHKFIIIKHNYSYSDVGYNYNVRRTLSETNLINIIISKLI